MRNQVCTILISVSLILTYVFVSCKPQVDKAFVNEHDTHTQKALQGAWVNDLDGNVVFRFRGDSVFYDDSLSNPTTFYVTHDTLFIENHPVTTYLIKKLNSEEFIFVNSEGDEITLLKAARSSEDRKTKDTATLNQGKKIKKDTILVYNDKRYHAYTQVNPTTYKVYHQSMNSDGISIENVYYDNIVYIALYEGQRKIFGSNILKNEFAKLVPASYISQAVLSDIIVDKALANGVRFIAILSIPDGYTTYRVNIDINDKGEKRFSL